MTGICFALDCPTDYISINSEFVWMLSEFPQLFSKLLNIYTVVTLGNEYSN